MKSINDYKKRIGRDGSIEGSTVKHSKRSIMTFFKHSPSYEEVVLNDSTNTYKTQIVSDGKVPTLRTIIMYPGSEIHAGDIVKRRNDDLWLCLQQDSNDIYTKGSIEKCNIDLKWIDHNGVVQIHPSVFYFNTRSNFGVEEDRRMNLPDGRRQTVLQKNEHTTKLKRNDRFIIGSEAFRVIDTDYVSDTGLVNLSLESDQINSEDDNLELGIANYFSKKSDYRIEILNGSDAQISNQTLQLRISVLNKGVLVSNPQVNYSSSDESIVTVDSNGVVSPIGIGKATVTVVFNETTTSSINIVVTPLNTHNYTADISGEDSLAHGRTTTYLCRFMNNGLEISDESKFSLTTEDGSPTNLATITSQDSIKNTCTVRANDQRLLGTVVLEVKNANGLSVGHKRIKIKSLF